MRGRIVGSFFLIMGDADAAAPLAMAKANRIHFAVGLGTVNDEYGFWSTSCKACARGLDWNIGVTILAVVNAYSKVHTLARAC